MTSCLAVNETTIVLSSLPDDKCFMYSLYTKTMKNLIKKLGKSYKNIPTNGNEEQKACAAFSNDGKQFAFNTNKGKLLSIWNTEGWSLIENKTLAKHATAIVFTPKTNLVVVGDKIGDVHVFEEMPVRLLGQSSTILDICFSSDEKYIVTCDSDDKIRVSHYPNGKNIMHYMIGHEAYVSGISMLNNHILSGSGDSTLRLWDINSGYLLDTLTLHTAIQKIIELEELFIVQFFKSKEVHFIKTEIGENKMSINSFKTIKLESNVLDMAAHGNELWIITSNSVYMYGIVGNGEFILRIKSAEITYTLEMISNVVKSFVNSENTNLMIMLYKQMIDKQKSIEKKKHNKSSRSSQTKRLKQN